MAEQQTERSAQSSASLLLGSDNQGESTEEITIDYSSGVVRLRDRLFGESAQPLPQEIVNRRSKNAEPMLLSQAEDGSLPTLTAPEPETAPETDAPSETP